MIAKFAVSCVSLLLPLIVATNATAQGTFNYWIQWKHSGEIEVPFSLVIQTSRLLIKGTGVSSDRCNNRGMVIPKNGSATSKTIVGETTASYSTDGTTHRVIVVDIGEPFRGMTPKSVAEFVFKPVNDKCDLLLYRSARRTFGPGPVGDVNPEGNDARSDYFQCVAYPLAQFEKKTPDCS